MAKPFFTCSKKVARARSWYEKNYHRLSPVERELYRSSEKAQLQVFAILAAAAVSLAAWGLYECLTA